MKQSIKTIDYYQQIN